MDTPLDPAVPNISTLKPAPNAPKNKPTAFVMGPHDTIGRTFEQGIRYLQKQIRRNKKKHRRDPQEGFFFAQKAAEMVLAEIEGMNGGDLAKTKAALTKDKGAMDLEAKILETRESLGFTGELNMKAEDDEDAEDDDLDDDLDADDEG